MLELHHRLLLLGLGPSTIAAIGSPNDASWKPPVETATRVEHGHDLEQQQQLARGWSPRPTGGPKAPFGRMDLFPRQFNSWVDSSTCGFDIGDGNPFTCIDDGYTCTYTEGHMGCCSDSLFCNNVKTRCIDRTDYSRSCTSLSDFQTICCTDSDFGECFTWVFTTTSSGGREGELEEFRLLDCAYRGGTSELVDYNPLLVDPTTTRTGPTRSGSDPTGTGSRWDDDDEDDEDDKEGNDEDDSGNDQDKDGDGNGDQNDSDNDDNDKDNNEGDGGGGGGGGGSDNTGVIVGGTIGGIAALSILGLAIFLLLRRRKSSKDPKDPSTPANPPDYPDPSGAPAMAQHQRPPPQQHQAHSPAAASSAAYPPSVTAKFHSYDPQPPQQGYDQRASGYGFPPVAAPYQPPSQPPQQPIYSQEAGMYPNQQQHYQQQQQQRQYAPYSPTASPLSHPGSSPSGLSSPGAMDGGHANLSPPSSHANELPSYTHSRFDGRTAELG